MQIITKELPLNHELVLTSDWHIGSVLADEDRIRAVIDYVASGKHRYVCLGGDLIEGITSDDKRFHFQTTKEPFAIRQARYVVDMLQPIKKKILFSLLGNHCVALQRFGDLQEEIICHELQIPYGTYETVFVANNNRKRQYAMFYTHGFRTIHSRAGRQMRQEASMKEMLVSRLENKMSVELMAMGHTHKLIAVEPTERLYVAPRLADDGEWSLKQGYTADVHEDWIHPDHRWYANTGSMLKLYAMGTSGYASRFGYDPTELGCVKVFVEGGKIKSVEKWVM